MNTLSVRIMFACSLTAATAFAQSNSRASLSGVVRDPREAVINGALVTVTNPQTGIGRQATTGNNDLYRFEPLPPGKHDLSVESPGFQKFSKRAIPLQVGALATEDVTLTITGSSSLDVVAEAPPIETTRAQQDNVTEQRAIAILTAATT